MKKTSKAQRAAMSAVNKASPRWYRARSRGQRVTLAYLWRTGVLERRVWRGEAGDPSAAHEYRTRKITVDVETTGLRPGVRSSPGEVIEQLTTHDAVQEPFARRGNDVIARADPGLDPTIMMDDAARALGWRTDFACGDSPITWELVIAEIRKIREIAREYMRERRESP